MPFPTSPRSAGISSALCAATGSSGVAVHSASRSPPMTKALYEKSINALACSEAGLRDCGAMISSLGISVLPDSKSAPLNSQVLPLALLPKPFPRERFDEVCELSGVIDKLIDNISTDPQWLVDSLQGVIGADDFTRKLVDVCREVYIEDGGREHASDIRLYLLRQDYLPTTVGNRLLQVEVNTVAAAFAGIVSRVSCLHRMTALAAFDGVAQFTLPENKVTNGFANAIAAANQAYNEKYGRNTHDICMVVEDGEDNECDQRFLESALLVNHSIAVHRRTLKQLAEQLLFDEKTKVVSIPNLVDPQRMTEISVFYFRAGYGPSHYTDDSCWDARKRIEQSAAVKCPSIPQQLAGTKKVQQLWYSDPSLMTRFGLTNEEADMMRQHFAVQVDPSTAEETVAEAIKNPMAWVLKPQREGGGHNMYGDELVDKLMKCNKEELKQYVLMERMLPAPLPCLAIDTKSSRDASRVIPKIISNAVSELGIYSTMLINGHNIIMDKTCGHMLRTKDQSVMEGGVHAGYAVMDTALLTDDDISIANSA